MNGAGAIAAIEIVIAAPAWRSAAPDIARRTRLAARAARAAGGHDGRITVLLTSDEEVRRLNRQFRGIDAPTNVLAFPTPSRPSPLAKGEPATLGDIALAFGVCEREAAEQGKRLADHLSHLVIHGVLHLAGHDHQRPDEAARMESLERRLLASLGLADPYLVG